MSSEFSQRKYDLARMTLEMNQGDDSVRKALALEAEESDCVRDLPCNHNDLNLIPAKIPKSGWVPWLPISAPERLRGVDPWDLLDSQPRQLGEFQVR